MSNFLQKRFNLVEEEEDDTAVAIPTDTSSPTITTKKSNFLTSRFGGGDETFDNSVKSYEAIKRNPAVFESAKRFLAERHNMTNIKDEDVIDEFIEHFRSFDVNEMTTAGDYGYVSAAAADATKRNDEKAKMRLADYRLLYQTFREMPHFYEEGGAENAFGDYVEGLLKAPSTYLGLLLPGYGKAAGVASSQAAKAAVAGTLRQAFQPQRIGSRMIQSAASNPIKTTIAGEAAFGALQNVAAQKTELEADLRREFSNEELLVTSVASGVLPAAAAVGLAKTGFSRFAERNVEDLLDDADKATLANIKKANEAADETLLNADKELLADTKEVLRALDPERVAEGEAARTKIKDKVIQEQEEAAGTTLPDDEFDFIPIHDLGYMLDPSKKKRVFAMGMDLIQRAGGRQTGERITETLGRGLRSMTKDEIETDFGIGKIFKKYDLTPDDFASLFMADVSAAARTLQGASSVRKLLDASFDDMFGLNAQRKGDLYGAVQTFEKEGSAGVRRFLEKADAVTDEVQITAAGRMLNGVRGADALRLAFMTSQTGTTVRNTVSGLGRVGIDAVTKAVDRGISKVLPGQKSLVGKANEDVFSVIFGITNKKEAMAIEAVFKSGFSAKASQMFRELQDIVDATNMKSGVKLDKMRAIGANLNALNQASDNMFKRAAFVGSLKRQLNEVFSSEIRAGNKTKADFEEFNLRDIVRKGEFKNRFSTAEGKAILDKAVEESLYFTYQKTPDSPLARSIISGIHKAPFLTTSLVPFPRFIANAMRFTYEYSPLYLMDAGFVRFAAKNKDNYEELAKGLVGTGFLMGATAYRMSEHSGENWWEGKKADGSTYDLRPFFPAAPFLFLGDLVARAVDQDVANIAGFKEQDRPLYGDRNELADAIQALSGTQFRAGSGLYALDAALRDVMAEDDPQKVERMLTAAAANIINTYSIPMTMLQDTFNTFAAPDDARIVKNTNSSDMLSFGINRSLARIPMNYKIEEYLSELIGTRPSETYQSPTRAEDLRRTTPFSRQVYGVLYNERKNRFEKELADLKISRRIVFAKTGVPEADALISQFMGEYITDYVVPAIEQSDVYDGLTREGKKDFLKRVIQEYRSDIMDIVTFNSKQPVYKERFGFDPMKKASFNRVPKVDQERALQVYHDNHGEPTDGAMYDYTMLLYYVKYLRQMRKAGVFDK